MLASSKPIHCFSPLSRKLDVGWPRIEDFQLQGHSCVNNVQRCLCHFYTWMRHSKQTATLLLTKRHANFDTSTSAKGYVRACVRTAHAQCSPWHTACSGLPHNALHSSSCIHGVVCEARTNLSICVSDIYVTPLLKILATYLYYVPVYYDMQQFIQFLQTMPFSSYRASICCTECTL